MHPFTAGLAVIGLAALPFLSSCTVVTAPDGTKTQSADVSAINAISAAGIAFADAFRPAPKATIEVVPEK